MSTMTGPRAPAVPVAVRSRRPGWRDPRLWVGLVLVAASVVVGARLVGEADRTVPVWAVRADLGAGAAVGAGDVEPRRVRFTDDADAARYLPADRPVPTDVTLARDVGAGELLPRAALATTDDSALARLTVLFQGVGAPAGLAQGDRVDVYVTSVVAARSVGEGTAAAVLRDVLVLDARSSAGSLTGVGGQEITLGVPTGTDLTGVVQAAKTDHLYLVQVG